MFLLSLFHSSFLGHSGAITGLQTTKNLPLLVSISEDGNVCLWRLDTFQLVMNFSNESWMRICSLQFFEHQNINKISLHSLYIRFRPQKPLACSIIIYNTRTDLISFLSLLFFYHERCKNFNVAYHFWHWNHSEIYVFCLGK